MDLLDSAQINRDLIPHRAVMIAMASFSAAALAACLYQGESWQWHWPEERRVIYRTVFYALAIVMFPAINLVRFVQVRLCQTMPGDKPAKQRYFTAVLVSMLLVTDIGFLGIGMFLFGDGVNTLYIFSAMAALGFILYRPKAAEYLSIVDALRRSGNA